MWEVGLQVFCVGSILDGDGSKALSAHLGVSREFPGAVRGAQHSVGASVGGEQSYAQVWRTVDRSWERIPVSGPVRWLQGRWVALQP